MGLIKMQQLLFVGFLMMTVSFGIAIPKDNKRTIDRIVSDEKHFDGSEHNAAYDHEAFLGPDDAKAFDQLSPEQSKAKLAEIVDKMDTDKDGFVDQNELKGWIHHASKNYILEDVERQWKNYKPENSDKISWEDYKKSTYGFMHELDENSVDEDSKTYRDMMRRDKRRWDLADQDHDGHLARTEFTDFLHPEEAPHMRGVVIDETLEDIDKDHDGQISLIEYISDMYAPDANEEQVPEWVSREKEQFSTYRDKNGDGFLNKEEIQEWIIPHDYDHSDAEAKHLIQESDTNKDMRLTKEEILDNYDLFVGSQATDFGEALMNHDEF
ncbi:Calumenin [Halotydeus destructor]|nr:Calumenin [Halotydeus destructor]